MILGIDTTTSLCSAALGGVEGKLFAAETDIGRGHAEHLLPMIEALISEAKITTKDIHTIIVTNGPGSFTGLRVGGSVAKGIAIATNADLIGVSTLTLMAFQIFSGHEHIDKVVVGIDARRGEVFAEEFVKDKESGLPISVSKAKAIPLDMFGEKGEVCATNSVLVADTLQKASVKTLLSPPSARSLVLLFERPAFQHLVNDRPGDFRAQSLYIRPPDAKLPAS